MDPKFLPAFSGWLRSIGEDVLSLANLLEAEDTPEPIRMVGAEALQSLLRSSDLIPEGLEALGYLEVAFALRARAARALSAHPELAEVSSSRLPSLGADAALVGEFLGEDLPRFEELAFGPTASTWAGRAAPEVLRDEDLRAALLRDVREWVEQYRPPELADGPEELVKISSFFRTRLRRAS
jgi:hypothetical protein